MFSTAELICAAMPASAATPSSLNSRLMPSVASRAQYCLIRLASGSVRMRRKSSSLSALSSTRMGNRPCSSGKRSDGLAMWKAPDAMNRMWSVFTGPCLVETVVPSMSGNKSLCTPSRLTSAPWRSDRAEILSISSMNTIPLFSTAAMASCTIFSWSRSLSLSSETSTS